MTDRRLPIPWDADAAKQATVLATVAVVLLVAGQGAVAAAVTGGDQPMGTAESLPASPAATEWQEAPSRTVSLSKQQMAVPFGGGSTDAVTVRALSNDTHVAFRMTWEDPTNDTSLTAPRNYSDAAAIMFRGGSKPPITMGATGTPVDIWYWRANWENGVERQSEWTGDMYAYPHPDEETKPGVLAGNPIATAGDGRHAQNYYAKGYGSLSHAPAQNVRADAVRRDGNWSVTFVRERSTNGTYDADFDESEQMYLAFAVWNGSAEEVNGQKSITLRFSTLDTKSGELAAAPRASGGSSAEDSGGDASENGGSGGSGGLPGLYGRLTQLLAIVVVAYAVSYWRVAR